MKKLWIIFALLAFGACHDIIVSPEIINEHGHEGQDTSKSKPDTTKVPGVDTMRTVSARITPQEAKVKVGDTIQFAVACAGLYGNPVQCPGTSWRTTNTLIAEAIGGGRFVARATGTTTVCAAITPLIEGCAVVIVSSVTPTYTIYGVFTSPAQFTMNCGQTQQVNAAVVGNGTVPQTVTWWSSDTTVAKVSSTGLVTGVKNGSALIHAVSTVDTTKMQHSYATVVGCAIQTDTIAIKIDPPTVNGNPNGEGKVTCTVSGPSSFTDRRCYFESRNPTIVQVVQKDSLFTTNTQPWGIGWRAGGTMKFMQLGSADVCAFLPARPSTPRVCSKVTVYAR